MYGLEKMLHEGDLVKHEQEGVERMVLYCTVSDIESSMAKPLGCGIIVVFTNGQGLDFVRLSRASIS